VKLQLSDPEIRKLKKAKKKLKESKDLLTLLSIKLDNITICVKHVEKLLKIIEEKYAF
jgi:hypothetical protein